jgi:hypothetical protein
MAYQMAYHQWLILIAYQMAYHCAYHHHFLSFLAQSQWLTITISPVALRVESNGCPAGRDFPKYPGHQIKPWRKPQLSINAQFLFYGNIAMEKYGNSHHF